MVTNSFISQAEKSLKNLGNIESSSAILNKKIEAASSFKALGFPTTKHEEWKYSNVKNIINSEYDINGLSDINVDDINNISLPNLSGNVLYFVNGVYNEAFSTIVSSNDAVKILPFKQALIEIPEVLEKHYASLTKDKLEAFTALNTAAAEDGVVIYIPDNQVVKESIIIRSLLDVKTGNVASNIRNLFVIGQNSEVKIAEAFRTIGDNKGFVNTVTEIFVDKYAKVDYYKVQNDNDLSAHIGTTEVIQKDKSYFYSATVTINGGFVRNNLNIAIDGEHIDTYMYGLYIPNGDQHVDNHTLVDHRKPNSQSNELYKGVLMDRSSGVFNGKIYVQEDAQKTNAYQNCRNVVTSDSASMNSKPQLEIWADDVKCSHGTTTGKLNDEAIFYMQSRGIPKSEAIKLQLLAFAEDVISQIKIDSIREYLEVLIHEKVQS